MADQQEHRVPVGSVAEEAARLLDALGGWVSTSGYAAEPRSAVGDHDDAADTEADSAEADAVAADAVAADAADNDDNDKDDNDNNGGDRGRPRAAASEDEPTGGQLPPDETEPHAAGHCEHCGAANGAGQAVTCQWCPVCQGIGLLRSVRPETVDRLADLAGALATALRDVATHTRSTSGATHAPKAPHDPRTRGSRVQDITIEDEDQGSATR